jgi:GH25 family lysozyme M1 (1,4-beta-N-acetylmuramidase)
MALNGIDIASYQKTLVPAQMTTTDFIIIKATQGNSYLNPTFKTQYQQAKAAGKLLGIYHYIDGSGADAEANYFVNAVKSVGGIGEAILAVDQESGQNSAWGNITYVKQLMDKIYSLTGVKPFIYVQHSAAAVYNNIQAAGYPLWGAQYANYNQTNYQSSPWRDGKNWGNWGADPKIRQYSSAGRIPGYAGNLDLDLFYGTKEDWKNYAKSGKTTTATATSTTTTTSSKGSVSVDFNNYYNKVSNSGGDERWGIRGGAAGDQTGHEWEIKAWYSYPWNCVLRYPDAKVRELIAELSIEAANNNNIGYDQG